MSADRTTDADDADVDAEETLRRLDAAEREARAGLRSLTAGFDELVEASAHSNADDEHDPEGATIAFERSQLGALLQHTQTQLEEVEAARARLAAGRYGRCEVCGAAIPPGRLEARPIARTCVACARGASS